MLPGLADAAKFIGIIAIMIMASLGNRWSFDVVLFASPELPAEGS